MSLHKIFQAQGLLLPAQVCKALDVEQPPRDVEIAISEPRPFDPSAQTVASFERPLTLWLQLTQVHFTSLDAIARLYLPRDADLSSAEFVNALARAWLLAVREVLP